MLLQSQTSTLGRLRLRFIKQALQSKKIFTEFDKSKSYVHLTIYNPFSSLSFHPIWNSISHFLLDIFFYQLCKQNITTSG